MKTAKEIVDLGVSDPEIFSLIGLLEQGIGPDRISDMTTRTILPSLFKFTETTCGKLNVPTESFSFPKLGGLTAKLPRNPLLESRTPILLVPRDILRDLPVAADWHGVEAASDHNEELRNKVNSLIANIWAMKSKEQKAAARRKFTQSKEAFESLMEAIASIKIKPYDAKEDPAGHYLWRKALRDIAGEYPLKIGRPKNFGLSAIESVVEQIVAKFKELIENNGLWKLLWHDQKPRREKSAQLLFFAIAEAYCQANGLDISPEVDAGAGPVDFKMSKGYDYRVVVELKLSTGKVVDGYMKQLEIYKRGERKALGIYVILDIGDIRDKVESVLKIKNAMAREGQRASSVFVIDATPKPSASRA